MICQEEQSCADAFIPTSPAAAAAAAIMEHSFDSALPSLNDHHLSFSQGLSSSDDESFQGKESKENGHHNKDGKSYLYIYVYTRPLSFHRTNINTHIYYPHPPPQ
jgi:hypothetical protein